MRLFLVRHGETEVNVKGLALGRSDVPLNERGRWQARRLAEVLSGEPIAAVYASPLLRALDTARAIAEPHGLAVALEPRLIEMDIGDTEGLTFAEVRERYPDLVERLLGRDSATIPGGERLVDVQERAWQAVEGVRQRHPKGRVAVVSHNFVIRSILVKALGMELAHFLRLRQALAAISVLDLEEDRSLVVRLNDTCHLVDED